jgi:hypothetical protein
LNRAGFSPLLLRRSEGEIEVGFKKEQTKHEIGSFLAYRDVRLVYRDVLKGL